MLQWLTFAAASLAAVGAVIGPVLSYRAAVRNAESRHQQELDRRQQQDVDRYVEFAISPEASVRGLGLSHLGFLLHSGTLTAVQANAASAAVTAAFRRAEEIVEEHPQAAVAKVADEVPIGDELVATWDDEDE